MFAQRIRIVGALAVVLGATVVLSLLCPVAEAKMTLKDKVGEKEIKLQIYGFSQLEARGGDGASSEGGVFFQAQRIRVGFNYFHAGPIAGKLFLDFNQSHSSTEAGLPKMIKDAFVAYKFSDSAFVRVGMIKTPVGMMFTVPGWNLDIVERQGLDKGLVLERDFGVLLSGRLIGQENYEGKKQMKTNGLEMGTERQGYGFGYDIGVFNPAGRSSAVIWDSSILGDALSYAGRLHYDYGPELHVELSYGTSESAGGGPASIAAGGNPGPTDIGTFNRGSEDYTVTGFGVASELWDWKQEVKFEYIMGEDIRGVSGWDQSTWSVTWGYLFNPACQFVIKTYQSTSDRPEQIDDGTGTIVSSIRDTDLGNTYVGFNIYPKRASDKHRDLQRHKLVINYIFTNGDDADSSVSWGGLSGYRDDAWAFQWQYKY